MAVGDYDIVVCGDSFCCASNLELKHVGTRAHFSQILEDQWGYRVLNLAHGGVSNTCILWQIREAELLRPKTIVYNRTFEGRVDLMLNDQFRADRGLRNWGYWEDHMTSYQTAYTNQFPKADQEPSVLSVVHQGLSDNQKLNLDDLQLAAVESWLVYFFASEMFQEMSNWHFAYWHQRMVEGGIRPLALRHKQVGEIAWRFAGDNPTYDSPFHTDRATQQQIAENIHALIQSGEQLHDGWHWGWDKS